MLSGNLVSLLSPFFITVPISYMAPQVYISKCDRPPIVCLPDLVQALTTTSMYSFEL